MRTQSIDCATERERVNEAAATWSNENTINQGIPQLTKQPAME